MKVKYEFGYFYEVETGKRLLFKNDSIYEFDGVIKMEEPTINKKINHFNPENTLKNSVKVNKYKILFKKGSELYFVINRNSKSHKFYIEILDDLYIYNSKKMSDDKYRLYDCNCILKGIESHDFYLTPNMENYPIQSISINDMYKQTFETFFEKSGHPATNTFSSFFYKGKDLDFYRNQIIQELK
jgi:hypothetical protein